MLPVAVSRSTILNSTQFDKKIYHLLLILFNLSVTKDIFACFCCIYKPRSTIAFFPNELKSGGGNWLFFSYKFVFLRLVLHSFERMQTGYDL